MDELTVRDVRDGDLAAVADIFGHYVTSSVATFETEVPSMQAWHERVRELHAARWPFLVGTVHEQVVGYAYVSPWRAKPAYGRTVENSVYVDPAHRGRGYGRTLLADLLIRAGAAGAREVIAVIAAADTDGRASVALHARADFSTVGVLTGVGHKHGRWLDTTLMQASLAAHGDVGGRP